MGPSCFRCCDLQGGEGPGLSRPSDLPALADDSPGGRLPRGGQSAASLLRCLSGRAGNEPKRVKTTLEKPRFPLMSQCKGPDTPGVLGSLGGLGRQGSPSSSGRRERPGGGRGACPQAAAEGDPTVRGAHPGPQSPHSSLQTVPPPRGWGAAGPASPPQVSCSWGRGPLHAPGPLEGPARSHPALSPRTAEPSACLNVPLDPGTARIAVRRSPGRSWRS